MTIQITEEQAISLLSSVEFDTPATRYLEQSLNAQGWRYGTLKGTQEIRWLRPDEEQEEW